MIAQAGRFVYIIQLLHCRHSFFTLQTQLFYSADTAFLHCKNSLITLQKQFLSTVKGD